ncbi:pyridoxal phosphate-dependent aminotransferase [Alphaproteobacteria bacterium]|nr:pyridoxal phosphate-dependent aminotransferase [Alphaproteobacteria bacterium]
MMHTRAANLGTETAFSVLARAAELSAQGRDVINLGIGQPDFPTPPHIVEAGIKALRDGHHGYTPSKGILSLREAVAESLHNSYHAEINPDHVQILPGGKVVMFFATQLLGEAGAEIIYPDPGFPIYASSIRFSGATPVPYSLSEDKGFALDADDILSKITDKTRLIIINSPANPTGGVTPRAEIEKLVHGLTKHPHIYLMSDEIYDKLVFDGSEMTSCLSFPEIRDQLIVLNGWSKTYAMTGWRLGYGIWPISLAETADRLAVNTHSCVNAAAQFAALAALTGDQSCVEDMRQAFQRRAELLHQGLNVLPGVTCAAPTGAFYAFCNITGTQITSADLQSRLIEDYGVAVISGTSFGQMGEGYLRFSCANSDEAITSALARFDTCLRA